ncbi:serine hydrolase [Mycolicibacterium thermoresistibile]
MPGPAPTTETRRSRRRVGGLVAVAALTAAVVGGCADPGAPAADAAYGAHIPTGSPQGLRAKQTMDMLNSDWPIGEVSVSTLAAPTDVDEITATMETLWWDRPITVTAVDIGAGTATLQVRNSYGVEQDIELHVDEATSLVDDFDVRLRPPAIDDWADIDTELTESGARYSYQVSRVTPDATCEPVAGTNTAMSLPLASIFKLYVLLAVADAIHAGTLDWDDQLTVTEEAKAVGSAGLDDLPPGAQISVRDASQQMISASDNMTTDLLINRLGPGAVERALVAAGHHDPASMTPFPTMHELFSVGWGEPDLREQWQQASPQDRAKLLQQTKNRPYRPDPERTHTPASNYGAEWYGSAEDICRVHLALQQAAVGPAAPVRDILSAIPGVSVDRSQWDYIAAKGGNLPGDLTFSWYAVDRTGQPWVVSFQLNWPQYRSKTAAGWLLSIVHQAFELIPID